MVLARASLARAVAASLLLIPPVPLAAADEPVGGCSIPFLPSRMVETDLWISTVRTVRIVEEREHLMIRSIDRVDLGGMDASGVFVPELTIEVPDVFDATLGDIDGDGDLDLAALTEVTYEPPLAHLEVWLNDGAGSFAQSDEHVAEATLRGPILLADAEGDGDLDMYVRNAGEAFPNSDGGITIIDGDVFFYRNGGSGTFALDRVLDVGGLVYASAAADLDQSGQIDVVASLVFPERLLYVYLDDDPDPIILETELQLGRLLAEDLTGDGVLDLADTDPGMSAIVVLPGVGDGTFGPAIPSPVDAAAFLHLFDANHDGVTDAAVRSGPYSSGRVAATLFGDGAGGFTLASTTPIPRDLGNGWAVGDFDGDAEADLLLRHGSHLYSFVRGTGQGAFVIGPDPVLVPVDELADMDGDGRLDLVGAWPSNTVAITYNLGDRTFGPTTELTVQHPRECHAADLDLDGDVDVAVVGNETGVFLVMNDGDGAFSVEWIDPGVVTRDLDVADVDGDGAPDLVVGSWHNHAVSVLLGVGDGSFGAPIVRPLSESGGRVAAADLDGDGAAEIVAGSDEVTLLEVVGGELQVVWQRVVRDTWMSGVELHDTDADGDLDIALSFYQRDNAILLNDGSGGFPPEDVIQFDLTTNELAFDDIDRDGRPDALLSNGPDDAIGWARGIDGGFEEPVRTYGVVSGYHVLSADLDGDGHLDLVKGRAATVIWGEGCPLGDLDGDGAIGIADIESLLASWGPCSGPCPADLDGDGVVDVDDLLALIALVEV